MKNIILAILLFIASLEAKDLQKVSLQLKWKYQFQFAGFIVAKEKGFYKDVGLDVDLKEFNNGVNIIKDVQKGYANFGVSDSSLIYEALKDKPVIAMMALFQDSPFVLMGLKSSNINSIKEMNGKKIAFYKGVGGISIKAMLKSKGVKYIAKPPIFTLDKLLSKDIDLMMAYVSNEPYIAKAKGIKVTTISPKECGFKPYGDILFTSRQLLKSNPKLVKDFYKASYKGWEYAYTHIDKVVDIIYNKYNSLHKTKKALKYEALALKRLSQYGTDNFLKLNIEKVKVIASQFNILNNKYNKLKTLDNFIYKPTKKKSENKTTLFTKKELAYIKMKKNVKVCGYNVGYPFVILNGKKSSGISIDYLKLIQNISHLNFKIVEAKNFKDYFKMLQDGTCDVSPFTLTKPNLHKFLTPTKPIISDSFALVTKITQPYIDDLNSLGNKKIAIKKGAKNLIRYVKSHYPKMNLVEVEDLDLHNITNGKYYGEIAPFYKMSYLITTDFFSSLKIMSKIGNKKVNGSFGITTREPILLTIFNKAIDNISQSEKRKIASSWFHVDIEKQFDYTLFIQVVSVALFIIMTLIFLYIKQRKLKKELKELNNSLAIRVKDATKELKEKNELANTLLNTTMEAIIISNEKYNMVQANQIAIDMLQISAVDNLSRYNILDFVPKEELSQVQEALSKQRIVPYELDIYKTDKTLFPALTKGSDVVIGGKKHRITTLIDLTEVKQKEKQNFQQSKLAQMGEMISMIAHQWRQPLNTISASSINLSLLSSIDMLEDKKLQESSNLIQNQCQVMSETINTFINFVKPSKESKEFKLSHTLEAIIQIMGTQLINHNIKVNIEATNNNISVVGQEDLLQQVIINLLANARDAFEEREQEEKFINITLYKRDDIPIIRVEDNAGGIPQEIEDKVFNPYFTTKEPGKGTGIGLYMRLDIMRKSFKGDLVFTAVDGGSWFEVVCGGGI